MSSFDDAGPGACASARSAAAALGDDTLGACGAAAAIDDGDLNPSACDLCPRACGANRAAGERGACGAGAEVLVARAALHLWEEPPISGDNGSGTIFFAHCPLRCDYCQNAVIAHGALGAPARVPDLAAMCLDLEQQGALNVNFVTPTHYAPHARAAVRLARVRGLALPIVWNTSGYETARAIRDNANEVDVYLTDFKYADASLGARYSHVPDYPERATEALDAMVRAVGAPAYDEYRGQERMTRGVVVRHLILPGHLDDSKRVVQTVHERYGADVRLSIMNQYTPVVATAAQAGDARARRVLARCPELACRVPDEEYEELLDFADALGVPDYFWQEGGACEESFIPEFSGTGA
ncbi:radical SAM protein [Adlercreutzia sp. ZJ242]|uniref:radical SAM protein n=1 Tax=Adlercreutzia sp. ZJ242 TaxID=2709409 RepID=UPI001F152781|nr:radical SAM protein [Adlercreutzia sp. ZJ242]